MRRSSCLVLFRLQQQQDVTRHRHRAGPPDRLDLGALPLSSAPRPRWTRPDCAVEPMLVLIFDIPVPYSNEYLSRPDTVPGARQCVWAPLFNLFCPSSPPAKRRRALPAVPQRTATRRTLGEEEEAPDLHIHPALGHYSYVFYLDDACRRQVVDLMKRATEAAISVGRRLHCCEHRVVQCHPRPPRDFLRNELTKHKITRTTSVSGEEKADRLAPTARSVCDGTDGAPAKRSSSDPAVFPRNDFSGSLPVREREYPR